MRVKVAPLLSVVTVWVCLCGLAGLLSGVLAQSALADGLSLSEPGVSSSSGPGFSLKPSKDEPYAVCKPPTKTTAACMALSVPTRAEIAEAKANFEAGLGPAPTFTPSYEGSGVEGGYMRNELVSAYKLTETGGSGQTIAIVDAYDDANAESDLNTYRHANGLAECLKSTGCFRKINQEGKEEKYPTEKFPAEENWGFEISLDLDMVSAICPECNIVLAEANNNKLNGEGISNLDLAENAAANFTVGGKKVVTEISNSWGSTEEASELEEDSKYFNHGVPTTVAAGDDGYGVTYPATSPNVIAVGGTQLTKSTGSRGWSEEVWAGTGSGCSKFELQPEWQSGLPCKGEKTYRVDDDVAAVASPQSPVEVYDSYEDKCSAELQLEKKCWVLAGGTSVSAPILAGVEALSTSTFREEGPKAFYKHQALTYDVAAGANGVCTPPGEPLLLCHGEPGYDGPTGNGTPDIKGSVTPTVATATTMVLSRHEVSLRGSVDPQGLETHYKFEYGPTISYGTSVPASEPSVGSGTSYQAVSQNVGGLAVGNTYHYRVVATNSKGTTYGEDRTFYTTRWAIQQTPKPEGVGPETEGVSCPSASACFAVGAVQTLSRIPFAQRWNGTEWSSQSIPLPAGAKYGWSTDVSCTSSSACTAAGEYEVEATKAVLPWAERWNGTAWSAQTTPSPNEYAGLRGVSCTSATACTAVGFYFNSSNAYVTLAESWNGTTWTVQSTPNPSEAYDSYLEKVSCSSSTACTAVGYDTAKGGDFLLVERWNGTEWKLQTPASPPESVGLQFWDVSCVSTTACTAVGNYDNSSTLAKLPLAEFWNGTEWKIQSTPTLPGSNPYLHGVVCRSSSNCTAVGNYLRQVGGVNVETPVVENWNGTEWTTEATPEGEVGSIELRLTALSCPSYDCSAVGFKPGSDSLLAEQRAALKPFAETKTATGATAGEVTLHGIVNPEGTETKYHFEYGTTISYGKSTTEVSVGAGASNLEESKLITGLESSTLYHYRIVATNASGTTDGADLTFTTLGWSIKSTPNPAGAKASGLTGTWCISASNCQATGAYENSSGLVLTLAESWNGTKWEIKSTPNPEGAKDTWLAGVSCASSSACESVGTYYNGAGKLVTVAEGWNGTEWKIQSTPNPEESQESELNQVSCVSSTVCEATGWYINSVTRYVPLAESWNGTEWKIQTVPKPEGSELDVLTDVSCTSATACEASSYSETEGGTTTTVAEQWNGTKWVIQSTPNPEGTKTSQLEAISCTSGSACEATGFYVNSSSINVPLAEIWNGTEWKLQTAINPEGSKGATLEALSCTSSTACQATGSYKNSSNVPVTLAEIWNGTNWSIKATQNPEGAKQSYLTGISCTSSTVCTAVGEYENSSGVGETLAENY